MIKSDIKHYIITVIMILMVIGAFIGCGETDHNISGAVERKISERPKPKVTGQFGFKGYNWEYIEINHHRFIVGLKDQYVSGGAYGQGLMSHDPDCPNEVCVKMRMGNM